MRPTPADVTGLLHAWGAGEEAALERLIPIVHRELHEIAGRAMRREHPGNTLQTTALVNEAFLRLVDAGRVQWQDRTHFFAVSAQAMRRILVDSARARHADKRGGSALKFQLDEAVDATPARSSDLIALDEALDALAELDPRKAKLIELRFFGGLSVAETAEVLKISPQSVLRDWKLARAWLLREMSH